MHGQITLHHNKLRTGCHCTAPEHRSDLGQLRSHGLRQRVIYTRHRLTRRRRRRILSRQPRPGRRHGRRRRWRWRGDVLPSILAVELGVHHQAASNNASIKPSVSISLRSSVVCACTEWCGARTCGACPRPGCRRASAAIPRLAPSSPNRAAAQAPHARPPSQRAAAAPSFAATQQSIVHRSPSRIVSQPWKRSE